MKRMQFQTIWCRGILGRGDLARLPPVVCPGQRYSDRQDAGTQRVPGVGVEFAGHWTGVHVGTDCGHRGGSGGPQHVVRRGRIGWRLEDDQLRDDLEHRSSTVTVRIRSAVWRSIRTIGTWCGSARARTTVSGVWVTATASTSRWTVARVLRAWAWGTPSTLARS